MPTLYLATGDGPVIVTRRGDRWRAERSLEADSALRITSDLFSCIAPDPALPERVFCGTAAHGVWRSDNAGREWRRVFEGLPHERTTRLAVSAAERIGGHGVVYVGTEPSAVFRSEDGGEAWQECVGLTDLPSAGEWSFPPRPETHHVRWIEPDPHAPGRLHVAIEAGALVLSPDGGQTWRDRVPSAPRDTHQLATHPDTPGRLWSAAGDGFFESDDAGETWRQAEQGLRFRYCWSLAIDPADPATVVLSASPGARQAHGVEQAESTIYRRTSGHKQWREVRAGLPEPKGVRAYVLSANAAEPGVFYAAAHADAFYRSHDAGATWQRLNVEWPTEDRCSRVHALAAVETG